MQKKISGFESLQKKQEHHHMGQGKTWKKPRGWPTLCVFAAQWCCRRRKQQCRKPNSSLSAVQ